jgi:hypothetical protein
MVSSSFGTRSGKPSSLPLQHDEIDGAPEAPLEAPSEGLPALDRLALTGYGMA